MRFAGARLFEECSRIYRANSLRDDYSLPRSLHGNQGAMQSTLGRAVRPEISGSGVRWFCAQAMQIMRRLLGSFRRQEHQLLPRVGLDTFSRVEMLDWSNWYRRVDSAAAELGPWEVWRSPAVNDPLWDAFLRSVPYGQFQQSSLWAEFKADDGWNHHRVILTGTAGIVGGFQVLWKKNWMGKVGYVSKGPVVVPEDSPLAHVARRLLAEVAQELGLTALISQRPDDTSLDLGEDDSPFLQSNPMGVIESTCLVDVSDGIEAARRRMHPSIRKNIRKARQQKVVVREGTEADIPRFFELMEATCKRQRVVPNPGSVQALRRLWQIFSPTKSIRLFLAECEGASPAGQLCLLFGHRVTLWKKGWDGTHPHWHATELLEDETFDWAQRNGYKVCDFCAISRSTALQILSGRGADREGGRSRDAFNLRFGGFPKLLPSSYILIPNRFLRWGFQNTFARYEQRRDQIAARSKN